MMAKLANMDQAQSTEYLTSIMAGYKLEIEDLMPTIDKMVALDNAYATSVAEIAEAMKRSSNVARISGVDLNELAGIITITSAKTRKSAETIGESWKTILTRMQNVKLGKNLDEEGESISDVEKVLASFDIKLRDSNRQFRNMGDVLDETAIKWKELGEAGRTVDQARLSVAFAGTRQAENFKAFMENYDEYLRALEIEKKSLGLTEERYKIFAEGIEASSNKMKAAWEGMWQATINSDAIKFFYDLSGAIFNTTTEMGGLIAIMEKAQGMPGFVILQLAWKGISELYNKAFNLSNKSEKEELDILIKAYNDIEANGLLNEKDKATALDNLSNKMDILRKQIFSINDPDNLDGFERRMIAAKNSTVETTDALLELDKINEDIANTTSFSNAFDFSGQFSSFDKLSEITESFKDLGTVSIENADIIKGMFPDTYQDILQSVNGLIVLDTQALKDNMLITIENAISKLTAMQAIKGSADAFRMEIAALESYKLILGNGIPQSIKTAEAAQKKYDDSRRKVVEEQQKAYDELLRKTIDGLKKEKEAQRDALQSQLDGYKKIIDASKQLLDQKHQEQEYADTISEKNKTISDIENELLQIQFDNSESANARRLELEDEKAKAVKDLADTEADHSVETQKDALDKEYDQYKDFIDNQIKVIEAYLADIDSITAQAISMIGERVADYIDTMTNVAIDGMKRLGEQAIATASQYDALLSAMSRTTFGGWGASGEVSWANESQYTPDWALPPNYNIPTPSNWYQPSSAGHEQGIGGMGGYHEGGIVGEKSANNLPKLKDNEVYAKLMKGEVVSTESQISNFMRNTLPRLVANSGGTMGNINMPLTFNIAGDLDRSVIPDLKNIINDTVSKAFKNKGFVRPATSFAN
jgi:TP901 family phage tail tape measure protein